MKRVSPTHRFLHASLGLALAVALLTTNARDARAAAPMPRPGGATTSDAERSGALRIGGSSQVVIPHSKAFPQFALDLSKFPRDGVAHRNILVVLCQFSDEKPAAVSTPRYFHNLLFSEDPNDGLISLREYYKTQSGGRLIISGAVTGEWLDMPGSYAYYEAGLAGLGSYPQNAQALAEDAMHAAYEHYDNDLGYFDNDGPDGVPSSGDDDGYLDAVMVMVPGYGGEVACDAPDQYPPCTRLWAHQFAVANYAGYLPGLVLGDKRGFLYYLGSEYNEMPGDRASGTWFHEFSHTLGLPDLYDLTGPAGLGFYSLMALGNYLPFAGAPITSGGNFGERAGSLDAWSRQYLGFDDPVTVTTSGHYTLAPVTRGGGSLKIWSSGASGTEYFLLENRVREGSDAFVPGEGLLVYHVDDTKLDNLDGPAGYRVHILQADGLNELELPRTQGAYTGSFGDPEDFFPGTLNKTSLTEATNPSTRTFAGLDSGIRITNITFVNDIISFDLEIAQDPVLRLVTVEVQDPAGDGDGVPDPNETVRLLPTIQNVGLPSGALTLNLITSDPAITVNNSANGTPMAPGSTQEISFFEVAIGDVGTPRVVPFTLSWSDDLGNSGSVDFTMTVGLAATLVEDFESGQEPGVLWTHEPLPGSAADEWHASTSRKNGGSWSAKLGSSNPLGQGSIEGQSYAPFQDAVLVSPPFRIGSGQELVFDSYIDAESHGGTDSYDGGRVEISLNGGAWTPLAVDGGYSHQIKYDSGANLRGADVFSGSPGVWRRVTADLAAYEGQARIRFRFASDGGNYPFGPGDVPLRVFEGWYIDNVLVRARTEVTVARRLKLRAGPSPYRVGAPSAGSIHVRFSAPDGLPHPELQPEVQIYDVAGRHVRTLQASQDGVVPSEFRAVWDVRDGNGNALRAGIYFAKVDIQGSTESFRLVVIR